MCFASLPQNQECKLHVWTCLKLNMWVKVHHVSSKHPKLYRSENIRGSTKERIPLAAFSQCVTKIQVIKMQFVYNSFHNTPLHKTCHVWVCLSSDSFYPGQQNSQATGHNNGLKFRARMRWKSLTQCLCDRGRGSGFQFQFLLLTAVGAEQVLSSLWASRATS